MRRTLQWILGVFLFALPMTRVIEAKPDFDRIKKMANKGVADSQRLYARYLLHNKKYSESYKYYLMAIEDGKSASAAEEFAGNLKNSKWSESFLSKRKGVTFVKKKGLSLAEAFALKYYREAERLGSTNIAAGLASLSTSAKELFNIYKDKEFPRADCVLGQLYTLGEGVSKDSERAIVHLNRCAAVSRELFATLSLSSLYIHRSNQTELDRQMAYAWMNAEGGGVVSSEPLFEVVKKAAKNGNANAQFLYAFALSRGIEDVSDVHSRKRKARPEKSFQWTLKAAEAGHVIAQSFLGSYYSNGYGGAVKNTTKSNLWHQKAADSGFYSSLYTLGKSYLLAKNGLQKDEGRAFDYLTKAAIAGDTSAMYWMGRIHEDGRGLDKNPKKAAEWYTKGANKNGWWCQYQLAHLYFDGNGVIPSYQTAFHLFSKGLKKKDKNAYSMLGRMYSEGLGVEQDFKKSVEYFSMMKTDYGDYRVYCDLVKLSNPDQDVNKGIKGLKRLAQKGHGWSAVKLGDLYRDGEVLNSNKTEAIKWYERALELGEKNVRSDIAMLKGEKGAVSTKRERFKSNKSIKPPLKLSWDDSIVDVLDRLRSKSGVKNISISLGSRSLGKIDVTQSKSKKSSDLILGFLMQKFNADHWCYGLTRELKVFAFPDNSMQCKGNGSSFATGIQIRKMTNLELTLKASLVKLNSIPFDVSVSFQLNPAFGLTGSKSNYSSTEFALEQSVKQSLEELANSKDNYSSAGLMLPTRIKSVELTSNSGKITSQGLQVIGVSLSKKYLSKPSSNRQLEIKDQKGKSLVLDFRSKSAKISYEKEVITKNLLDEYSSHIEKQDSIEDSLGEL